MTTDPTIRAQGYQYFLQEAPELLQVLETGLLTLQEDSSINKVNTLMRATHTLKGAAASLELETIAKVAHSLEDVFRALCRPAVSIDAEVEALLFEGFECLRLALRAELTEATANDNEILDRTATIFARLQDHLGDCFDQNAHIPTSVELGFDVTQSIFEVGVAQRLDQLAAALETEPPKEILTVLQTQAEVFLGLGESLNLPGFEAIAQVAIAALKQHPDQVIAIAQLALKDFQAGQTVVLAGDRDQGGQPSEALQALAQIQAHDQVADYSVENTPIVLGNTAAVTEESAVLEETAIIEESALDQETEATETTTIPVIHKLFQWMRGSVQPSSGQMNEAQGVASPKRSGSVAESDQTSAQEVYETPNLSLEQPHDDNANTLLENIWGADAAPTNANSNPESDLNPAALVISPEAINPNVKPKSAAEPETLRLRDLSNLPNAQPAGQQPTPLPNKGLMAHTPTVRIQIEHLDQLNYAVGELLTNHNQQSLQAEQIKTAVRHLHKRLQQHQQLLSQLQDWVDYQQIPQARSQMGDWQITPLRQSVPPAFQSESWGASQYPQVSRPLPIRFDALELDQYSEPQLVIQSLLDDTVQLTEAADAIELFTRQSRQTQEQQGRLLLKTRDALIESRMFPLGQLFERFPGVLQQLETLHHKPVELTLHGTEVLVDKAIAERLYDPILHLVRNAFDHGIEPVAVRQQRAKPKTGQLEIAAYHQGKHLVIEVQDDGQGLDFERIRQQAVERQLVSPQQAHNLSQAQLTDLLFEPGFSTTSQISSLSGRGVGLDVVRNQLQALQGEVRVTSVAHQGTTFTLHIPLSLTIAKLLLCQANARAYALLPDAIEQILIPQPDQIQQRDHCKVLWWGEDEAACWIPIYALSDLLDYHGQAQRLPTQSASPLMPKTSVPHILLIRHQGVLLGIEVAQMLGEQELVIRPLNPLLETHAYIYGASILADGQLTLVLDGAALAESASNLSVSNLQVDSKAIYDSTHLSIETLAASTHPQQLSITTDLETGKQLGHKLLIVDDSVTTRQTLTLTLQKAGYQVIQAQDGQEAVDQLLQHPNVQLVICDIEMPRMNGFELLQHCQNDSALVKIPVMMLSSRSSEKHRFLAEQLGAIAYVSKPYLEHKLLSMIAEVLEAEVLNPISG